MFADFTECGNLFNFNDSLNSEHQLGYNLFYFIWTLFNADNIFIKYKLKLK